MNDSFPHPRILELNAFEFLKFQFMINFSFNLLITCIIPVLKALDVLPVRECDFYTLLGNDLSFPAYFSSDLLGIASELPINVLLDTSPAPVYSPSHEEAPPRPICALAFHSILHITQTITQSSHCNLHPSANIHLYSNAYRDFDEHPNPHPHLHPYSSP